MGAVGERGQDHCIRARTGCPTGRAYGAQSFAADAERAAGGFPVPLFCGGARGGVVHRVVGG